MVIELAIRHVKEGKLEVYKKALREFHAEWSKQPGVIADRESQAIMTLPKQLENIFIGMTAWESQEAFNVASKKFEDTPKLTALLDTVNLPVFGLITQKEGTPFDLSNLINDTQILEVAVRKPKDGNIQEFDEARKSYFSLLSKQDGVQQSFEFSMEEQPENGLRVGMNIYENKEKWQAVMQKTGDSPEGKKFFSVIDVTIVAYCINASK